ncbi:MAG TPA: indole-3-glycerol-phosphate synthase [Actinomycetota bacterium]|nr:indole-3-glycerol-phosphate synthase [Actinomycetota bacterium]
MGFLTDLVRRIRADLAAHPLDAGALEPAAAAARPARDLAGALRTDRTLSVIAEVKRASPSVGAIAADADPVERATAYAAGGAAAISVLTEPVHFGGSLDDLRAVTAVVGTPVLRKDFLVTEPQVLQARAAGADSILLITSCLSDDELEKLLGRARALGMEPLVETHDDADLGRALASDARIVGVNARNLETLEVDVDAALARLRLIPPDRIAVLESGVTGPEHAAAAAAAGASAILVGETLMRAGDPAAAIRQLRAVVPERG